MFPHRTEKAGAVRGRKGETGALRDRLGKDQRPQELLLGAEGKGIVARKVDRLLVATSVDDVGEAAGDGLR
jgi:hypothetical protein